ncbi:MAG: NAD-dependent epimerase/dehydratase family protein [Cyclobacteriaceae bacterium]
MKKQSVFITGGDGLLGSNLIRVLVERNYKVTVFQVKGSKSQTLEGLPIKKVEGDILDFESIDKAMADHEVVIHAAANTTMWPPKSKAIIDVNLRGTINVVNSAIKNRAQRFIHVGTANTFKNGSLAQPGNESSEGVRTYGLDYIESKRNAQKYVLRAVKELGLPGLVVNPTFLIGPYDSKPGSGEMILSIYKGKIPVVPNGSKTYVAAKDAAIAIANAIEMGKVGDCYILGNHNYTYKQAFKIISECVGAVSPKYMLPDILIRYYGKINSFLAKIFRFNPKVTRELALISCEDHCYSGEKARNELQMPVTSLYEAVGESFAWLKENGYVRRNEL